MDDKEAEAQMTASAIAAERFWDFSLAVYGQDPARHAFLRLQDECYADVPMLLWCLWCGAEGIVLSDEAMAEAVQFTLGWREAAVLPLRALRRAMKPGIFGAPDPLTEEGRGAVAHAEQTLERLQMEHLVTLTNPPSVAPSRDLALDTVTIYAKTAGLALVRQYVEAILDHAGPMGG